MHDDCDLFFEIDNLMTLLLVPIYFFKPIIRNYENAKGSFKFKRKHGIFSCTKLTIKQRQLIYM